MLDKEAWRSKGAKSTLARHNEATRWLTATLSSDLHRYAGGVTARGFVKHFARGETFRYVAALRWTQAAARLSDVTGYVAGRLGRLALRRLRRRLGINIPWTTSIGPG